jgi:hypothetical protein
LSFKLLIIRTFQQGFSTDLAYFKVALNRVTNQVLAIKRGEKTKPIVITTTANFTNTVAAIGNFVASFVPCLVVDLSFVPTLGLVARLSLYFNKFQCVHEAYVNTFLRASNLPHKCSRIHVYTYRSYDCNLPISKPSLYTYCTSKSLTISTS